MLIITFFSDRRDNKGRSRKRLDSRTALRPILKAFNAHGTISRWLHSRVQWSSCTRHCHDTHETLTSNQQISLIFKEFEIIWRKKNMKWKQNRRSRASTEWNEILLIANLSRIGQRDDPNASSYTVVTLVYRFCARHVCFCARHVCDVTSEWTSNKTGKKKKDSTWSKRVARVCGGWWSGKAPLIRDSRVSVRKISWRQWTFLPYIPSN